MPFDDAPSAPFRGHAGFSSGFFLFSSRYQPLPAVTKTDGPRLSSPGGGSGYLRIEHSIGYSALILFLKAVLAGMASHLPQKESPTDFAPFHPSALPVPPFPQVFKEHGARSQLSLEPAPQQG